MRRVRHPRNAKRVRGTARVQLEKALRMKREWDERKAIVYEQLTQYRQLHAELVCLKAGVNRFVEAQGRDVHGRFKAGQKGCT